MIEDLDGGDHGPSRTALVRGVSVALAFATLLGWAALSSPALRGPYATPDPLNALAAPVAAARYTPEPTTLMNPAVSVIWIDCPPRGFTFSTTVFVNGQPVSINAQDKVIGVAVPVPIAPSLHSFCLVPEPHVPFDRFAR